METLRRLPAREPPLPGESLASLVRRHAVAMGYERVGRIRSRLADRWTLPPHLNHLPPGPILDGFAELFGCASQRLRATTVHCHAGPLVLVPHSVPPAQICDSKTILRFFRSSAPPVCPRCLDSEVPFERLVWSFRPLPVCLTHACLLFGRCPNCRRPLHPSRLDPRRCRCGLDLTGAPAEPLSASALRLVGTLHQGLTGQNPPLPETAPEMAVAASFWWLERLAGAARRTPAWTAAIRQRHDLPAASSDEFATWLAAAEMLSEWPERFEQFLEVFQTVAKHRTSDTGLSRSFGLLLREAAHLEEFGHPAPAEALRHYLLQCYTRGHLSAKVCLFKDARHHELVGQRPWITRTEAADRLGLRHAAIAELVRRGVLIGEVHPAGRRGRSVGLVSCPSVEALRHQLESSLTVNRAAKRLGIGRGRIFELIHADLLSGAVRTARGWMIPRPSVETWERLFQSLPVIERRSSPWLTVREATRRFGRGGWTLARLLELVQSGRVRGGRKPHSENLGGLLVHRDDLDGARSEVRDREHRQCGYPLHRLARELIPGRPLKDAVLRKWIDAGLLRAERQGAIRRIPVEEVQRFRSTYCLADEACRLLGVSRSTLSRWETAGSISAVYGRRTLRGAGASLFRREDVERLLAARAGDGNSD